MILKIIAGLVLPLTTFAAAFQYGGIKHDITSQVSTISVIVMNAASTQVQRVTGSSAQDIKLPDATTLRAGYWYRIVNESSGAMTIRNSSSTLIGSLAAGSTSAPKYAHLYLTSNSTSGGPWTFETPASSALSPSGVTPGSYTSADITVDVNGIVTAAASGGGGSSFSQHDIYLQNGNGHGSTNTKIRRYSNVRRNTGTNLTLTQSSTDGDSMTANTSGSYAFCAGDYAAASGVQIGISVNGSALTTNIGSISFAQGKRTINIGVSNADSRTTCWFGVLAANDVVRVQTNGSPTDTTSRSYFMGSYLGTGNSTAYLENGSGHGSTNTKIRTYTNIRENAGSDITVTQSATNGDSLTVNASGIYGGCFGDGRSGSNEPIGITVNGSALTTNVSSVSYAQGLRVFDENATSGQSSNACFVAYLSNGDVVRVQDHGNSDYTSTESYFYLTEISAQDEFIHASTGSSHGSTGTKIRTFSNLNASNGYDLQYRKSAVYGDSIIVNEDGQYVVCYSDQRSASTTSNAITLSGMAGTTNANTPLTYTEHSVRALATGGANFNMPQVCYSSYMYKGTFVHPHDDGTNDLAADRATFFMVRTR